jgi:hypothetical protein
MSEFSTVELCEHNKFFRLSKLLCLAFLLFAVSIANASPTTTHHTTDLSTSLSLANPRTATSGSINTVVKPVNDELANLAKEFLQPPESSAALLNLSSNSVRLLPAVPATVLMLLTGFLCISFYRDRKVWLMALIGLLWAGQTSIQALPQLALRLSHGNHSQQQFSSTELSYPHYLENSNRLRSDVEGTRYIGLLHHLGGIPDAKSVINSHISQPAIIFKQDSLTLQFHCMAFKAEQLICFSPAFIFESIPRGPPKLA